MLIMQASEQYRGHTAYFTDDTPPPLDKSVGYIVMVGFGLFFSILCAVTSHVHLRHYNIKLTSEYFTTAGRDVGLGLTSCAVLSSWTWSATILQSANVTWRYGVSGAFWYASGASVQIILFAIMSFHLKKNARNAHTIGEIIYARWGSCVHKVFL